MNNSGTKTGLFLMELVIALLLFAFCAAICMQLFASARDRARASDDLSQSVYLATSAAECYKTSGGSLEAVSVNMNGEYDGDNGIEGNTLILKFGKSSKNSETGSKLRMVVTDLSGTAEIEVFNVRPNGTEKLVYSITARAVSGVA